MSLSKSFCIIEINRLVTKVNYSIETSGKRRITFSLNDFKKYCKENAIYESELYCKQYKGSYKYLFYYKIVEDIVNEIKLNPSKYIKTHD